MKTNFEAQLEACPPSQRTVILPVGQLPAYPNPLESVTVVKGPAETDPNGFDPHAPGAKLDAGKPRPSLIISQMSRALTEVAKVGTYGANKYTDGGWQFVPNGVARYTDAMDRHRLKEGSEDCDKDTDLLHAAHLAWNSLARLELMLRERELEKPV